MVIVLVLVTLFFTWQTGGKMLLPQNVTNLIAQNSYVFIRATGILTGGNIDLSVGSVVCFVVFKSRANRVKKGYETEPLAGVAIKTAIICIAILAFMFRLAQYKGIPNVLIWVLVVVLIYSYITSKTTIGRHFYAVGGNEKATQLSGINTNKVYFTAYLNTGLLAAVASMVTIVSLNSANPTAGTNYEMDAIGS